MKIRLVILPLYRCKLCDYQRTTRSAITSHLRTKHKDVVGTNLNWDVLLEKFINQKRLLDWEYLMSTLLLLIIQVQLKLILPWSIGSDCRTIPSRLSLLFGVDSSSYYQTKFEWNATVKTCWTLTFYRKYRIQVDPVQWSGESFL